MKLARLLSMALALAASAPALAVDLTKIERTIGKLPELKSETPEYCLLVFGPEAARRVWVVFDGDVLYVDRNGNGDLSEPGERVAADANGSNPAENTFYFKAGDIPDEPTGHKELTLHWSKVTASSQANAAILSSSRSLGRCTMHVDVAMTGQQGDGIDGRVAHWVPSLKFSPRPADAPIVHFGGPWEITLNGTASLRVGRVNEVQLFLATPGLGPGATTAVAFHNIVPSAALPKVRILFPPASSGQPPIEQSFELARRCCTWNLYGDVRVPENVGTGKAKMEISLESLPAGYVAPTVHDVTILPPKPGPKLEPVSPRLAGRLQHEHPDGAIIGTQFSPDSKRLIASDYPGKVVHVWDLASGARVLRVEGGGARPGGFICFAVSDDWSRIFAFFERAGVFEKFQRDGKTLHRAKYDDLVRVWDIASARPVRTLQDSPPHMVRSLIASPDGKFALTHDDLPGEFELTRSSVMTLWDVSTGEHREVARDVYATVFSPDGKSFVASLARAGQTRFHQSIAIISVPGLTRLRDIPIRDETTSAYGAAFTPDGRILVGTTSTYVKPNDYQHAVNALKFWDASTGEEILSVPQPAPDETFYFPTVSPNGRLVAAATINRQLKYGRLVLVDLPARTFKVIDFNQPNQIRRIAFHPSGKWIAVLTISGTTTLAMKKSEAPVEDLAQPVIECVDVTTGEIRERIFTPQAYPYSLAFSPDGGTLATSGAGCVLLWDVRTPPGEKLAAHDR